MNQKAVNEIVMLVNNGWRPYNNQPCNSVYEELKCTVYKKKPPCWFVKGDKFLCISCASHCSLFRPHGFQLPLPIHYPVKAFEITKTPEELIKIRSALTVQEAAYCLNVSPRTIYDMVYTGKLAALREKPIRVKPADVAFMMNDFDE